MLFSLCKSHRLQRGGSATLDLRRRNSRAPKSIVRRGLVVEAKTKQVWIQTQSKDVATAAVESGFDTLVFDDSTRSLSSEWQQLATFKPLFFSGFEVQSGNGEKIGDVKIINEGQDLAEVQNDAENASGLVVMDASDWQIIPAENLVASFQGTDCELFASAKTCADAQVMLEALEVGTDGVVLKTEDPLEVRLLGEYILRKRDEQIEVLTYDTVKITRIEPIGMGERVCVDMCSMMLPGEGMLVGSFSRALFLVHSECAESQYISSRPFRVNAGAVHAYTQGPNGKTAYLSELESGSTVLIADARGRTREAIVGRIKQEHRPLVLVEGVLESGDVVSTILQNAETVRLVGPDGNQGDGKAISVSQLQEGDLVYALYQEGARHTGIAIQEQIVEK